MKQWRNRLGVYKNWIRIGRHWYRLPDLKRVPVIEGGGPPNTTQEDFAFGDDDGSEAGHSLDTQNANRTSQAVGTANKFLIRIIAEENNSKDDAWAFALRYQKNGAGGYIAIDTSTTEIRLIDDDNSRADDETTTFRLTWGGNQDADGGLYDDGTGAVGCSSITLNNSYGEWEFCIYIIDTVNDGDYYDLHLYSTAGVALDGYNQTPRVTAYNPSLGQPTPIRTWGVPTGSGSRDRPSGWN